jgi:LysR family nitrogen assimilation transcriptional regulator
MEIKELRYFKAIATLSSFSKAAVQLRIAQPALSRQMQKLERNLGTKIFQRQGRSIGLTAAGRTLLGEVDHILRQLELARLAVAGTVSQATGHISLGVTPATGRQLLPSLLEKYRERCPAVTIHVVEGFGGYLHEWLVDGRADIAVLYNPSNSSELVIKPLGTESLHLIGSARRSEPMRPRYRLSDVTALPLILPRRAHSLRNVIDSALAQQKLSIRPIIEVDGDATLRSLVRKGLGYTIMTYSSVAEDIQRGDLRASPIERPEIVFTLAAAVRNEVRENQAVKEMLSLIEEETDRLIQSGEWRCEKYRAGARKDGAAERDSPRQSSASPRRRAAAKTSRAGSISPKPSRSGRGRSPA